MTSPEPAPPADPTSYRRPGVRLGPWLAIVLVAVSLVIGVAVGLNATRLFSDPEAVEAVQNFAANPFSPAPVRAVEEPVVPVEQTIAPPPADIAGVVARLEQVEANQARVGMASSRRRTLFFATVRLQRATCACVLPLSRRPIRRVSVRIVRTRASVCQSSLGVSTPYRRSASSKRGLTG